MKEEKKKFHWNWKIAFWIVLGLLIITLLTSTETKCDVCEVCEDSKCEKLENGFYNMCELHNNQVDLVNQALDYIDDFANPEGQYLQRQVKLDCSGLLNLLN